MVQKQNKSLYPVVSMWGQVWPTMSRRTSIFSLSRLFSSDSSWFCLRSFITSLWLAPPAPLSAISKIFLNNQMHQYWICKNLRKNSSKTNIFEIVKIFVISKFSFFFYLQPTFHFQTESHCPLVSIWLVPHQARIPPWTGRHLGVDWTESVLALGVSSWEKTCFQRVKEACLLTVNTE